MYDICSTVRTKQIEHLRMEICLLNQKAFTLGMTDKEYNFERKAIFKRLLGDSYEEAIQNEQ